MAGYDHFAHEFAVLHPGEIIRRLAALRHHGDTYNIRIIFHARLLLLYPVFLLSMTWFATCTQPPLTGSERTG